MWALYGSKGDLENALIQFQKALVIQTRVFGSEHLDVAASLNNLGSVYFSLGQYEQALEYYQKSLDTRIRVTGTKPPERGCVQGKHMSSLQTHWKEE